MARELAQLQRLQQGQRHDSRDGAVDATGQARPRPARPQPSPGCSRQCHADFPCLNGGHASFIDTAYDCSGSASYRRVPRPPDTTVCQGDYRLAASTLKEAAGIAREQGDDYTEATALEYLAELAFGLTNRQIAERLAVTPATVKTHLSHIFSKLGVASRSELTGQVWRRRQQQTAADSDSPRGRNGGDGE